MKSQMQRLQSRISKRRNAISAIDTEISVLVEVKMYVELPREHQKALTRFREYASTMGADQKLDKELFQMLLSQERNKYAGYFRSAYKPVEKTLTVAELCDSITAEIRKQLPNQPFMRVPMPQNYTGAH